MNISPRTLVILVSVTLSTIGLIGGMWWYLSHNSNQLVSPSPLNTILVKADALYDLYLSIGDGATTTGQFLLLEKQDNKQIPLGEPFEATRFELTGFWAQSVTKLLVSGDERYVAFDNGTSVERNYHVFATSTGKDIVMFCAIGEPLFWHDSVIYLACDRTNLDISFEAGAPNIDAVNLLNDATTTLVASNISKKLFFYRLEGISDNILHYQSTPLVREVGGLWNLGTSTPIDTTLDLIRTSQDGGPL